MIEINYTLEFKRENDAGYFVEDSCDFLFRW